MSVYSCPGTQLFPGHGEKRAEMIDGFLNLCFQIYPVSLTFYQSSGVSEAGRRPWDQQYLLWQPCSATVKFYFITTDGPSNLNNPGIKIQDRLSLCLCLTWHTNKEASILPGDYKSHFLVGKKKKINWGLGSLNAFSMLYILFWHLQEGTSKCDDGEGGMSQERASA